MAADGQGEKKSIDDALEARVGQVLNDFLDRRERGVQVSEAELLAQHPDLAAELKEHLDLLRDIEPTRHALVELLNRGILAPSADTRYPGRLGPYQVVGLLGRGGMGVVLKAYEERLNRTVALKLLRPELTSDKTALARFEQEAKAAAGLQHPNIVAVHAIGEENGTHFIVMEFVSGPTLATLIRNEGPLPAERVRVLFGQILAGLKAAHGAGLVHRDIKSSNILLHGSEQLVKIADFGLARMLSAETRMTMSGSIFGTPEYMSPEQARGEENIDHRTDLYSAGVVLYEMLTGRVPFRADASSAMIHAILNMEPPPPHVLCTSADKHLSRLALRLMAKRKDDRFASASDALVALSSATDAPLPNQRRRLRRRAVGVLVAAAVVVGGGLLARSIAVRIQGSELDWLKNPAISAVWVETAGDKGGRTRTIIARYGRKAEPEVFYTFPEAAKSVVNVVLVTLSDGEQRVIAGVVDPWEGACLFGFDAQRKLIWRADMSDARPWPDCGEPTKWQCRAVNKIRSNDASGEQIVAVSCDRNEYPTRVSIVDPGTGRIGPTFWHAGQISAILVVPDFFAKNHSAIVAWGQNNKLDGFGKTPPFPYVQQSGEDAPRTRYNIVRVAMILDPQSLDGSGPPHMPNSLALPSALPYAYAFLDMPPSTQGDFVPADSSARRKPTEQEIGSIQRVERVPCGAEGKPDTCFDVHITGGEGWGGVILPVDQNLSLRATPIVAGPARTDLSEQDWTERWRPIVQHGKYVSH